MPRPGATSRCPPPRTLSEPRRRALLPSRGPPAGRRASIPVCSSHRPNTFARWTSQPARYCSAPHLSYSCSTRITRAAAGGSVGWHRHRAWMEEVFSSAEITNSSGSRGLSPTDGRTGRGPGRPCYREKSVRVGCPPGRVADGVRFCAQRRASGQEAWRERTPSRRAEPRRGGTVCDVLRRVPRITRPPPSTGLTRCRSQGKVLPKQHLQNSI